MMITIVLNDNHSTHCRRTLCLRAQSTQPIIVSYVYLPGDELPMCNNDHAI